MASRETRLQRGRRRGRELLNSRLADLRSRRIVLGIGQPQLAAELGISVSQLWRMEARISEGVGVIRLSEVASLLGLEVSLGLHPIGDPIRDKGQQALGKRFDALVGPAWRSTAETLLPGSGELRAWDRLLRLVGYRERYLVGVDLETRIRDIQDLVRRTRGRERDGQTDAILIVLSDSATNRRLVDQLRVALGPDYQTSPRQIGAALREGRPLPGSGVILI